MTRDEHDRQHERERGEWQSDEEHGSPPELLQQPPATRGPSADSPPPIADHKAIAFVRAGPAHSAVMSASVVGYAMPAETPPTMRAKMRKPSDGAYAAAMDAGIDSEIPRTSIILRP